MQRPPNLTVLSELPADYAGYATADEATLRRVVDVEQRHFWHRARNRFILHRLGALGCAPGARVLELGCGTGAVSEALSAAGYDVIGVEGHLARTVEAARRSPRARFFVHALEQGVGPLPADNDVVALFDVIEHLEQPGAALAAAFTRVRPGGWLVGTVPAHAWLWSDEDVHAGHRRRYDEASLRAVCAPLAGEPVEVHPFFSALVPLLLVQRRLLPTRGPPGFPSVPPQVINRALDGLLRLERRLDGPLRRLRAPGASLWFAVKRSR